MKLFKIFTTAIIALCATSAWADLRKSETSSEVCSPKIHFKLPEGWSNAYLMIGGMGVEFPKADADGWSMIDLGKTTTNNAAAFFINSVNNTACISSKCVTKLGITSGLNGSMSNVGFTCSSIGKESGLDYWIMPHPDVKKEGEIYTKNTKPNIRDFFIFLPNNSIWKSATPLIYEVSADGKVKDVELYYDTDNCGWYYRRYIDEEIPKEVVVHRDDDENREEAIGLNGSWEEGESATPIPLKDFMYVYSSLDDFNNALYFVADEEEAAKLPNTFQGWYTMRPPAEGKCGYDLAAIVYDTDASLHGAFTCAPNWSQAIDGTEKVNYNACYYASAKYQINSTGEAVVPCVGVTKGMVENTLAFDPTTKKKYMKLTSKGKQCFGSQAEEAFNAMFNYTKGVNEMYCFNMEFTQAADGKFEFDSDTYHSPNATVRGGFYPAEQEPDAVMMMSPRLPAAETKRKAEGPTFFCPDDPMNRTTQTPMGLRTIHPSEKVPLSDLMCDGGGWEGGIDCEGLFVTGSEFSNSGEMYSPGKKLQSEFLKSYGKTVTWAGDGWGWSCGHISGAIPEGWPLYTEGTEKIATNGNGTFRWTSTEGGKDDDGQAFTKAGRNQHFCFESHATFRYKKNLKFSFRGDDDIWVFINNKLAVDLGGSHLPAPGYVDVDKFMAADAPTVGDSYPIDIYFCDRRTTMSNVHIKTNMFIEQKTGIELRANQDKADYTETGNNHYLICYTQSGDGSCAAALSATADTSCGSSIMQEITYELTTDKTGQDPDKVVVSEAAFKASPKQFNGGIDVSKMGEPIINRDILKNYFAKGGTYYLLIHIGNQTMATEIKISGSISVADRDAVFMDDNGNYLPIYSFKSQSMASSQDANGAYDISQMAPLYIAAISDPCSGDINCADPLELASARGTAYTLSVNNDKALFFELQNGVLTLINPTKSRKVGDSGVDTLYVTVPLDEMRTSVETVGVNVSGSSRVATVNFFAPTLAFVKDSTSFKEITKDEDSYARMKGQSYEFYVVALNPDMTICTECNFPLAMGSQSSPGLQLLNNNNEIVNGRATIWIRSTQAYYRDATGDGTAMFTIVGPNANLTSATYKNMQFVEPPVSTPQFADIFDVHGEVPKTEMNIPEPYFNTDQEYLDGIGDSLVVYYHRTLHKDSLPDKIVVYWDDNQKDSVEFGAKDISKGVSCGTKFKWNGKALSDKECLNQISLSGKKLSKTVKTSGTGKISSWITYCPRFNADGKTCNVTPVTADYKAVIYDRIAPVILSAKVSTENKTAKLQLEFSEKIKKTTKGADEGNNVFSFYINSVKKPKFYDKLTLASGVTIADNLTSSYTLPFSTSDTYPQPGDYIHFRGIKNVGLIEDQSNYTLADSLRKAWSPKDSTYNWNAAPSYNATNRLPSPWVLITENKISSSSSSKKGSSSASSSDSKNTDYGDIDFYVKMVGAFEFEIVIDESLPSSANKYAVMDMMGQVVSVGELNEKCARVKVPTAGAYVVKVNLAYKRVNIR